MLSRKEAMSYLKQGCTITHVTLSNKWYIIRDSNDYLEVCAKVAQKLPLQHFVSFDPTLAVHYKLA